MPRKIDPRGGPDAAVIPRAMARESAGKNRSKRLNAREKYFGRGAAVAGVQRDRHLSCVFSLERLRRRSFSLLEVSRKCSHLIHIYSRSALPAGLRVETIAKIDKKKTELYFSSRKKKS